MAKQDKSNAQFCLYTYILDLVVYLWLLRVLHPDKKEVLRQSVEGGIMPPSLWPCYKIMKYHFVDHYPSSLCWWGGKHFVNLWEGVVVVTIFNLLLQVDWRFWLQDNLSSLCHTLLCFLCGFFRKWARNSWSYPGMFMTMSC